MDVKGITGVTLGMGRIAIRPSFRIIADFSHSVGGCARFALLIWISRPPRDISISILASAVPECLYGILNVKIPITAYVMRSAIILLIQFQHRRC